ncbi:MAG TPA: pyridoxal phosphate-dependent aminotransferase [Candidatus Polarisedimenticolaceae bacterium]|nr:pyridoxal phosphate-dependent aminotransferase [Candidatus Polarisedimenticolaceae bacterium]
MSDKPTGAVSSDRDEPVPIDRDRVRAIVERSGVDVRRASIREMNKLVNTIEQQLEIRFVRMEFGIPGLPLDPVAIDAESQALRERHVGNVYAPFDGVPELKREASRFVKLFMDLDIPPACCIPTVGAMEGCFASLALAAQIKRGRNKIICLDPGFPVNKLQIRFLGLERESIDFYDHRGQVLVDAVDRLASRGDVAAVLWSSPNNPSWIVLRETELAGLGAVCDRHDILAIEDLAYFGMDVRRDYTVPGQPPFQPTVLRHTHNGICIISSSKMFSYAGQRIAIAILSPELMDKRAPDMVERFGTANVGHAFIHGVLYPIAACVAETPQYGMLSLLREVNDGNRRLFWPALEYSRRARIVKKIFLDNGFRLVYDNDLGQPLADGFYFTVSHPAYESGAELLMELLHYGVSAITLETTGSTRTEGLRACVSLIGDEQFATLRARLERFRRDHPV